MMPSPNNRVCGDCQLCCKLLPTEEINKPANTRCKHQSSSCGCKIYPRRPMSCALWNCRWLINDDTHDQVRPDRSHIVLDMMPDVIRMTDNRSGEVKTIPVIVAWVDPDHKHAVETDQFLRYVARQTVPVLIRFGSHGGGGVLFPPAMTGQPDVKWHPSELGPDMPSTLREKAAAIGAVMSEAPALGEIAAVTLTMPDGTTKTVAAQSKPDFVHVETAEQAFNLLRRLSQSGPPRR